jgi:hypothetical protein
MYAARGTYRRAYRPAPVDHGQDRAEANYARFEAAEPVVCEWLRAKSFSFGFAASLLESVFRYGTLTENQLAAARRCLARERPEAPEVLPAPSPATTVAASYVAPIPVPTIEIDGSRINLAFTAATAAGLTKPRLRYGDLLLSLAGSSSRNPGNVYVKFEGTYIGRLDGTRFVPGREWPTLTEEQRKATTENLRSIAHDPVAAAANHGHSTGHCTCCGRFLSDPPSVARGVGPICFENFGWGRF